jgi:AraC-like DNA-binding protein
MKPISVEIPPSDASAPPRAAAAPAARAQARTMLPVQALTPHLYIPTPARPLRAKRRMLHADTQVVPHAHPWPQLTFSVAGVIRVVAASGTYIVPPSRAVWLPATLEHSITVVEDAELQTLYFHPARLPAGGPWDRCVVLEVSDLLRALVLALDTAPDRAGAASDDLLYRESLVVPLLHDELGRAGTVRMGVPLPTDKRLRALCERVLQDPTRHATLEAWAQDTGASGRTVARLFQRELGTTFMQWRQQVVLARALPLIAGGRPLAQVADALGYDSASAFSAMFRKALGAPPSRFLVRARNTPPARRH